jgi:hypothetical protein
MKKYNIQLITVLLLLFSMNLYAQQQYDPTAITQEIDYNINKHGDAYMEIRQKMTAMQWQIFKASAIAKNPSIFKRDLERSFATMQIENFKNEMNEDTRSSITQLTARNMATYKGNGKWEIKLETKEPNITKLSDDLYMITNNLLNNGSVIQQLQKISFPKNATNIKQDTDTYGNAVFVYTLNVEETSFNFLLLFGIMLILGGAVWKFTPLVMKKIKFNKSLNN